MRSLTLIWLALLRDTLGLGALCPRNAGTKLLALCTAASRPLFGTVLSLLWTQ